jgi:carbamoyltransferase
MKIFGINALNHDTSICVFDKDILFHKKSKNSLYLTNDLVEEAKKFGNPDVIAWYENPWLKKTRQIYAGQFKDALSFKNLPSVYLKQFNLNSIPIFYAPHHLSHAHFGVYSSGFDNTAVLVVDAIGEWNTVSIWNYSYGNFERVMVKNYPYSLGLFYSAFTELIGLKPVRDESVLMNISQKGNPWIYHDKVKSYLDKNLHKGIWDWDVNTSNSNDTINIAASVQFVFEKEIIKLANIARQYSNKLVFTGGCAYNKFVHNKIKILFKDFHVPNFPGDAGSSIGAALYISKKIL